MVEFSNYGNSPNSPNSPHITYVDTNIFIAEHIALSEELFPMSKGIHYNHALSDAHLLLPLFVFCFNEKH